MFRSTMLAGKLALVAILMGAVARAPEPLFTDADRQTGLSYWKQEGRYLVSVPEEASKKGKWVVRETTDGSQWLWNYNKARGLSKGNPIAIPGALNSDQAPWEAWIDAKLEFDKFQAAQEAASKNSAEGFPATAPTTEAQDPGPEPDGLMTLVGPAPKLAEVVAPTRHTITFDDGTVITGCDHVDVPRRYAYYRFGEGLRMGGIPLKKLSVPDLRDLFNDAGISESEQRVMTAVSGLEGGFDGLNTYDTGFVSVGFIQYACLTSGGGSLGEMLIAMKTSMPKEFETQFHKYGVDVDAGGILHALDLETGVEAVGPDAAKLIIKDKRLSAVFARAGKQSRGFQMAQVQQAKRRFYPANDHVKITLGSGETLDVTVSDVIKSECGMATLMDRKVNTGKIEPLTSVLQKIAQETGATSAADLAQYEADIIAQLKFRRDFMAMSGLSAPQNGRARSMNDRHGDRSKGGSTGGGV